MDKPSKEVAAMLDKLAERAARRYARRCWWMPKEDLQQEAWIAGLSALRTFDPEYGTPLAGYVWRAMVRWLRGFLWRNSAPVSVPWGNMTAAAGLTRTGLEKASTLPCEGSSPEDAIVGADREAKLKAALARCGLPMMEKRPWAIRKARKSYALYRLWKEG